MPRPFCADRLALDAALVDGDGTAAELAQRAGVCRRRATQVLDNMVRAGDVAKGEPVRVPGVKRPVPVYGRPVPQDDGDPMQSLIRAWLGTAGASSHSSAGAAM